MFRRAKAIIKSEVTAIVNKLNAVFGTIQGTVKFRLSKIVVCIGLLYKFPYKNFTLVRKGGRSMSKRREGGRGGKRGVECRIVYFL
jgi:hypothetical protein